jgi:hypothetical protein
MKYTIRHGSIAAVQHVATPEGREVTVTDGNDDTTRCTLPLAVQAAVNRQFGIIFALPYEKRQGFIDNSIPFEVEVTQ